MKRLKIAALTIGLLTAAAAVGPASAAVKIFDWSLNGPAASLGGFPLDASGQLTATQLSSGVWAVDSLTLKGSSANALTTFDGSDNKIYTNGFAALDTSGLAFKTAAGQTVDVFSFFAQGTPPTGNAYGEIVSPGGFGVGNFSVSAVPEPSIWLLMIAGVGAVGATLRQSKRRMGLSKAALSA